MRVLSLLFFFVFLAGTLIGCEEFNSSFSAKKAVTKDRDKDKPAKETADAKETPAPDLFKPLAEETKKRIEKSELTKAPESKGKEPTTIASSTSPPSPLPTTGSYSSSTAPAPYGPAPKVAAPPAPPVAPGMMGTPGKGMAGGSVTGLNMMGGSMLGKDPGKAGGMGMMGMSGAVTAKPPAAAPLPATAPTPPPAAVAEAVAGSAKNPGTAKKDEGPQSGILTAGSFDDNLDPPVFQSFVAKRAQSQGLGNLPGKMVGQRLQTIVRDGKGRPVGGARVKLTSKTGASAELVTRSDGRAIFMLSFDQLPANEPLAASVTPPDGGSPVTDTIIAGSARWDFVLPGMQAQLPKNLDLAIVLDTTGSMGDEITHLKAEIRGISAAIQKRFPEVQQRFALVVYRDDGDEYVARAFDFTPSVETFQNRIGAQVAAGGGDYPEAMHRGLEEANQLRWKDKDTAAVMFLIADAPPHAQHMNRTLSAANQLRKRGVSIYPVACSGYDNDCEFVMRSCALLTGSQFLFLTDDSGVGGAHAEPKIPYYSVERLERLMIRMIASELAGQRIDASPPDIIRSVGAKRVN